MSQTQELALPPIDRAPDLEQGSLFFIGTATVLLHYAGFTVLTDPNFLHQGEQVHLGYGLRSTRRTNPALSLEQLPKVDLIVLSHLHEDHFDRVVEQRLDKTIPIVTTPQAAATLSEKGFYSPRALHTWETLEVSKGQSRLSITAMPARHAPGLLSNLLPQVMGSMLEFQTPAGKTTFRLYITGDTLLHERLKEIPARYPDIDLALLHLGGTRIFGLLVTMDARQGVEALKIIAPRIAIPIHYDDYPVFKSPLGDFMKAIAAEGLHPHVHYLYAGESYPFAAREKQAR